MKFLLAPLAVLATVTAVFGQLMINTPTNVVVCQPILITWSGGQAPYFVSILPGGQPGAQALVTFPSTSDTSVTWTANIAAGTSIGLTIRDSTGTTAESAQFPINSGPDSSCVGKNPTSSGSGSAGPTTAGATTSSGTPATSTHTSATSTPVTTPTIPVTTPQPTSTTGTHTSSQSSSGSPTTTKPATTSNAAATQAAQLGAAGLIGAAVIALMA